MKVVCVDANVLVHCEPLQFLPWGQLVADPHILVVIVPSVAREIDRLKVSGSGQIQIKARRAAQVLRRIFSTEVATITLRAANPKVDVELVAAIGPNAGDPEGQGTYEHDERIVNEMLALGYNKSVLMLLTNDTVAAVKARDLGLQAELIPVEWLLAPEPSGVEQAIQRLRQELQLGPTARPRLALSFEDHAGNRINGALQLSVAMVPGLSPDELERCMAAVASAHPYSPRQKALSQSQLLRSVYGEAGRTYDQLYNEYIADCNRILRNLSKLVGISQCKGEFTLLINNVGSVPAKDLHVEITIGPDQWLLGKTAFLNNTIELPPSPAPGQDEVRYPHTGIDLSRFADSLDGEASEFHWRKASGSHREASAVCEAYRHGESRKFPLVVELAKLGTLEGKVRVRATASNIEEPVVVELPIQVVTREISRAQAIADGLIRGELAKILGQAVALA